MKPRTPKTNVFAELARARKVAILVLAVEDHARALGLDPVLDVEMVVRTFAGLDDAAWSLLAVNRGAHPPSEETRLHVYAMLRTRAADTLRERAS